MSNKLCNEYDVTYQIGFLSKNKIMNFNNQ